MRRLIVLSCMILALAGCGRVKKAPARIPQATDSLYTAQAAMKIYGTEPEQALAIVDSALTIGNVSSFRADFIRALIYANSVEKQQLNKAIDLCRNLLQHDSTQVVDTPTFKNRNNVLGVMMDACRKKSDEENWLRYAVERAELSWEHGMQTETLRMEAEIGAALTRVGRRDEGLIKLEQVIHALDEGAPSVDRMDAGIVARKRRIQVFEQNGRFRDMISDAQAIIRKLDDYNNRPSAYAQDSFRLTNESNMGRYCAFYQAQAWCFLARAYAQMTPKDAIQAAKYLYLFEASPFGHTYGGREMAAPAWKALGQWDKLLAVDAETERQLGTDTLVVAYANILKDRADVAKAKGQYLQAVSFMERYAHLQEKLREQNHVSDAQEYAARYHAIEQDYKLRQMESESKIKDAAIAVIVAILIIITSFSIHSVRQRNSIGEKNRALARMINEQSNANASQHTDVPLPDKRLFDLIDGAIRREKLYTNVNLQRQDIIDRFDINRHALNDLFSAYAEGQSFTSYINNLRLQEALRLIRKEPDTPVSAIAEAVGFTPANFREQFKREFGMTPTEYRQNA